MHKIASWSAGSKPAYVKATENTARRQSTRSYARRSPMTAVRAAGTGEWTSSHGRQQLTEYVPHRRFGGAHLPARDLARHVSTSRVRQSVISGHPLEAPPRTPRAGGVVVTGEPRAPGPNANSFIAPPLAERLVFWRSMPTGVNCSP